MPTQDAIPPIVFAIVPTTLLADTPVTVSVGGYGWLPLKLHAYGAVGDNTAASISVYTQPNGGGDMLFDTTTLPLSSPTVVSPRFPVDIVAGGSTIYIRPTAGTGVSGTSVRVAIYGYSLP